MGREQLLDARLERGAHCFQVIRIREHELRADVAAVRASLPSPLPATAVQRTEGGAP